MSSADLPLVADRDVIQLLGRLESNDPESLENLDYEFEKVVSKVESMPADSRGLYLERIRNALHESPYPTWVLRKTEYFDGLSKCENLFEAFVSELFSNSLTPALTDILAELYSICIDAAKSGSWHLPFGPSIVTILNCLRRLEYVVESTYAQHPLYADAKRGMDLIFSLIGITPSEIKVAHEKCKAFVDSNRLGEDRSLIVYHLPNILTLMMSGNLFPPRTLTFVGRPFHIDISLYVGTINCVGNVYEMPVPRSLYLFVQDYGSSIDDFYSEEEPFDYEQADSTSIGPPLPSAASAAAAGTAPRAPAKSVAASASLGPAADGTAPRAPAKSVAASASLGPAAAADPIRTPRRLLSTYSPSASAAGYESMSVSPAAVRSTSSMAFSAASGPKSQSPSTHSSRASASDQGQQRLRSDSASSRSHLMPK
jgi:hypothetical protein